MHYPKYVEVDGKKYKINTDFRVAIECQEIALDATIGNFERTLAILYKLYGDEGLQDFDNYAKLLELGQKYLACGKELESQNNAVPDMDFVQDMDYIEASFMSDYNIDLTQVEMHWWKFFNLMNGLSNSEMGNCCILNRVRNIRTYDTKDVKDQKELARINNLKKQVALKKRPTINKTLTVEQKHNIDEFYRKSKIDRKE